MQASSGHAAAPEWAEAALQQGQGSADVNAVVAKDGSGDFTTITSAVDDAPRKSMARHVIRVSRGLYEEVVRVPEDVWNLTLLGDGIGVTVVTGSRAIDDGYAMPETATVGKSDNLVCVFYYLATSFVCRAYKRMHVIT